MRRWTPQQFLAEAMRVHNGRYTYPDLLYVHAQTKIEIHCPDHGPFRQRPHKHLSGQGCPDCGHVAGAKKQRQTREMFVDNARAIHGDRYDYGLVEYINNHTNVTIMCPQHGPFSQTPGNHTHKTSPQGCRACAGYQPWTRERFLREAETVHGGKYDYSLVGLVICKTHKIQFLQSAASLSPECQERGKDRPRLVDFAQTALGLWVLHSRACTAADASNCGPISPPSPPSSPICSIPPGGAAVWLIALSWTVTTWPLEQLRGSGCRNTVATHTRHFAGR